MAAWFASLTRGRALELAAALALGYVVARLAETLALVPARVLAQNVSGALDFPDESRGLLLYELSFDVAGTVIIYGDVLASALALVLVALAAWFVVRRRDRELGACPACAARIPHGSTHCAYCGSATAAAPQ